MLEPSIIHRIRAIFLHPAPRVTIAEGAGMLGSSREEMDAAIRDGEIEVVEVGGGTWIERRELAAYAVQEWPLSAIEEALGREAGVVLPAGLRTRELTVRLPRYQIGVLERLAGEGRESVEVMLTRMFEELAELHRERLVPVIPGIVEAMGWPEGGGAFEEAPVVVARAIRGDDTSRDSAGLKVRPTGGTSPGVCCL